jgi:hypothetical protein
MRYPSFIDSTVKSREPLLVKDDPLEPNIIDGMTFRASLLLFPLAFSWAGASLPQGSDQEEKILERGDTPLNEAHFSYEKAR